MLALAAVIHRRPVLLPVLVLVALPFRVPLAVGGEDANLLLPLYLVMAAGVLVLAFHEFNGEAGLTGRSRWDAAHAEPPTGVASWAQAAAGPVGVCSTPSACSTRMTALRACSVSASSWCRSPWSSY